MSAEVFRAKCYAFCNLHRKGEGKGEREWQRERERMTVGKMLKIGESS